MTSRIVDNPPSQTAADSRVESVGAVVAAGAAGLVATYWDDGWHTVLGRDSALIPPHLLLYASMAVIGAVLAGRVVTQLIRTRLPRAVLRTPGLALAATAGIVVVAAAPADAAWHRAFGRDAVLWSPPHLVTVLATAVLIVAILLGQPTSGPRWLPVGLAAVLLGTAEMIVLEYETDVPQFPETLYLPVLLMLGLGTAWTIRSLAIDRFVVTFAVLAYLVFRVVLFAGFGVAGWITPEVPVALLGLLVVDLPVRWGAARWSVAGLTLVGLQLLSTAAGVSTVAFGASLRAAAIIVPLLVAVVLAGVLRGRIGQAAVVLTVLMAVSWLSAPPARAHDPGQGAAVGTAQLSVTGSGTGQITVIVSGLLGDAGATSEPTGLVARRAGRVVRAPLTGDRDAYRGIIVLPSPGRWFVYAEFSTSRGNVEVWLAVQQDQTGPLAERRALYIPAGGGPRPAGEYVAGGALFAVGAALVVWAGLTVRRRGSEPARPRQTSTAPVTGGGES